MPDPSVFLPKKGQCHRHRAGKHPIIQLRRIRTVKLAFFVVVIIAKQEDCQHFFLCPLPAGNIKLLEPASGKQFPIQCPWQCRGRQAVQQRVVAKPLPHQHVQPRVLPAIGEPETENVLLPLLRRDFAGKIDLLIQIQQQIRKRRVQVNSFAEIGAPPQVIMQLFPCQLRILRHIGEKVNLCALAPLPRV